MKYSSEEIDRLRKAVSGRKYSIEEIDQLRKAVKKELNPADYFFAGNEVEYSAMQRAWDHAVEERLRTYMLNGTLADELQR